MEPEAQPARMTLRQRGIAAGVAALAAVLFWFDAERTQEHAQIYVTMMEGAVARLLQWDALLSRRAALACALGSAWLCLGLLRARPEVRASQSEGDAAPTDSSR